MFIVSIFQENIKSFLVLLDECSDSNLFKFIAERNIVLRFEESGYCFIVTKLIRELSVATKNAVGGVVLTDNKNMPLISILLLAESCPICSILSALLLLATFFSRVGNHVQKIGHDKAASFANLRALLKEIRQLFVVILFIDEIIIQEMKERSRAKLIVDF